MRHSTERILVSHGGNLPRPPELDEFIDGGRNPQKDPASYTKGLPDGVKWVVDKQIELGVDIVNDGEYVKAGNFGGYINSRVSGIESFPADVRPRTPASGAATARTSPASSLRGWVAPVRAARSGPASSRCPVPSLPLFRRPSVRSASSPVRSSTPATTR